MGTVEEIGLFVTRISTLDNVQTYISNSRVFAGAVATSPTIAATTRSL